MIAVLSAIATTVTVVTVVGLGELAVSVLYFYPDNNPTGIKPTMSCSSDSISALPLSQYKQEMIALLLVLF